MIHVIKIFCRGYPAQNFMPFANWQAGNFAFQVFHTSPDFFPLTEITAEIAVVMKDGWLGIIEPNALFRNSRPGSGGKALPVPAGQGFFIQDIPVPGYQHFAGQGFD
jgi:hypothetical protein